MNIRKGLPKDAQAIAKIEELSIKRPWSIVLIENDLKTNPNATYYVAEDGEVLGFIGVHNIVGEINITNIAVNPTYRRQGIADKLMQAMLAEFSVRKENGEDIVGVTLEVRASNIPAIKLYEKYGFASEGIRKAYYSDGEDAIIMWNRNI